MNLQLWDYPKYGVPEKVAGKYYWQKNDGLQNQAVLYRQDNNEGRPWCW
ncbi:MAG: hypothetical protein KGZ50_01880 [Peptococcaceae bacterium]|nr:hypothetical protein [Peptococcaceae bacterium]